VETSDSSGLQTSSRAKVNKYIKYKYINISYLILSYFKVKENVKTASYGLVIAVGLGVTGVVVYTVFNVS
jgi:hypothetical protein